MFDLLNIAVSTGNSRPPLHSSVREMGEMNNDVKSENYSQQSLLDSLQFKLFYPSQM